MTKDAERVDDATLEWIKERFKEHYKTVKLEMPDRFARREFGFMFFDGGMVQRHLGFASPQELKTFLTTRVPAHVYYSSAYYEKPAAPTMEEKGWLGADLIFDLDADHIERVKGMPYKEMLQEVKNEIRRIVDHYILDDFGFDEKFVRIAFSGGRGYHIHVKDPRVWELGGHERREIVDYITGTELDEEMVFRKVPIEQVTKWGVKYRVEMPSPTEKGWRGRVARGILQGVEELERKRRDEAIKYLASFEGVGAKTAEEIYSVLFEGSKGSRGVDKLRRGDVDIFPSDRHLNRFKQVLLGYAVDLGKRETDEPVTSDVKRLIRMPSTLHGKSGLQVVLMTRDQLDSFEPLSNAVPDVFDDTPIKIELPKPIKFEMKGETFNLAEGVNEVPEFAAVFLACRGTAKVLRESPHGHKIQRQARGGLPSP